MRSIPMNALTTGCFAVCVALATASASAQSFPTKPIRWVVPFPAGGLDAVVRVVLPGVERDLRQPQVIDNRPGAGGTIGGNIVAKAAPDGYTLLCSDPGAAVHAVGLFKELPYDPGKDFVAVALLLTANLMISAGPGAKYSNLKEMIEYAKANPGALSIGDSGAGTIHHMSLELLKLRSGLNFQIIHYKGAANSVADLLGGQIPSIVTGTNSIVSLLAAGKIKPIAVAGKTRHPKYPDVPSLLEAVPSYDGTMSWTGVWAPAATPRDVLLKLNAVISKSVNGPEVAAGFGKFGLDPYAPGLEETNKFWRDELALWPDLIRRLGITLQ